MALEALFALGCAAVGALVTAAVMLITIVMPAHIQMNNYISVIEEKNRFTQRLLKGLREHSNVTFRNMADRVIEETKINN
jgi:hypothetical protein